jgi:hypothetical protein
MEILQNVKKDIDFLSRCKYNIFVIMSGGFVGMQRRSKH